MKKDYTHITFILDRSGSMRNLVNDTIGGVNSFVDEQKKVKGEATVSLVTFNTNIKTIRDFESLNDFKHITSEDFYTSGMTALHDAIGFTIDELGTKLSNMKEEDRPEKVVLVIVTDGFENSSVEFRASRIKEMITHQSDVYNWSFVFLGANQDAITTGKELGISRESSMSYMDSSIGTRNAYSAITKSVCDFRASEEPRSVFLSESDRKIQEELISNSNSK